MNRPRETGDQVNARFVAVAQKNSQVLVVNTWTLFAGKNGNANPASLKDLHRPNPAGYDRWAKALKVAFVDRAKGLKQ